MYKKHLTAKKVRNHPDNLKYWLEDQLVRVLPKSFDVYKLQKY